MVSNPNGPPHPFQRLDRHRFRSHLICFKPQRAASSIPTKRVNNIGLLILLFQTPTGRLIHSNHRPIPQPKWFAMTVSNPNGPPHPFQRQTYVCPPLGGVGHVSNPNGPPHPFQLTLGGILGIQRPTVSNPNGPPHPFQRPSNRVSLLKRSSFKPQRAASSIPTLRVLAPSQRRVLFVSNPNGPPHPFQQVCAFCPGQHSRSGFQTPTGRLIHSNEEMTGVLPLYIKVSNPNGPPHPFQLW